MVVTTWQHLHFHMAMFQPWLQKMTLYPSLADSGSQSGSCWRAGGNRVTRRQSGVVGRLQEPNAAPRRQRAGNNPGSNPPSSRQPFYGSLRTLHLSELSNCGIYVELSSVQRLSIREGFKKSKWKFKMAFAMKGGGWGLEGVSSATYLF